MKWIKKVAATPITSIAKVIDSLAAQTNDRTNAPSIRAVREAIQENWLIVYPVGSVYINVNDVDPATLFGGTWQQIKDRFLLACGDTYDNGATGGAASESYTPAGTVGNHTLTVNEMPEHIHEYTNYDNVGANLDGGQVQVLIKNSGLSPRITEETGGNQAHNHSFTGTAATIDTMPPYLAVNVWVRTA